MNGSDRLRDLANTLGNTSLSANEGDFVDLARLAADLGDALRDARSYVAWVNREENQPHTRDSLRRADEVLARLDAWGHEE